ncbi:LptA/OstA family protein [Deinococcus rubellus]|uniref:OstA family protein n=1 Tax=Deinococcus rubellus TaxID=1889240 RepID=A0ABY5YJB5_9DEIO|nr:LptA/OstA family protein [Deinococcus rubellus]UWX64888.1 OstA family protein [Deinococcus rubellus]
MTVRAWRRLTLSGVLLLGLALAQQSSPQSPSVQQPGLVPAEQTSAPAAGQPTADPVMPIESPAPGDSAPADPAPADVPLGADQSATDSPVTDPSGDAQEGANVTLTRKAKDGKERVIRIVRTGLTDDTGIFASCTPQDSDPAGSPTVSVFSETGPGGIQITVDKNLIRAPLALVTQQEGGDGHIEMSAGTARFLDNPPEGKTDRLSRCAVQADPKPAPDTVFVTQGRTSLQGQTLVYDESDGVARIGGPITFERAPAPGKSEADRLTGNSERIEVDVDKETTTLAGKVVLKNGARTSTADRVEYDDAANVAVLRGMPGALAQSVNGQEIICAMIIRYNLDLNTVTAVDKISGQFPDGEGGASAAGDAPGAGCSG